MLEILQIECFDDTQETLNVNSVLSFFKVAQARSLEIYKTRFQLHHLDYY